MGSSLDDNLIVNEIRALAVNLDVHAFEPLSGGIGLGELKPAPHLQREPAIIRDALRMSPAASRKTSAPASLARISWPLRGTLFLISHLMDIFVVAATLATGICLALFIQHTTSGPSARREEFLKLTHHIGYVKAVLVVYAVFGLYWLLFKLLSEGTIGQLWRKKALLGRIERNPYPEQNK